MKEPRICPNCKTPTTIVRSMFLSKSGMPESVEREVLRLYEKNKIHIHVVCNKCAKLHIYDKEFAWISVLDTLWGWIRKGNNLQWQISKLNKEMVEFT